ncbi:hypothetical protein [Nitratireductor sp. GCM10026969]|uniref:hypothetical protein n=1 Tax=Nitratireductor sp. GCM10026969 TaxID=3252645 RepID=UPI00360C93B4
MDERQATPPEEFPLLRSRSAEMFGDLLLCAAVRQLVETGGEAAVDALRKRAEMRIQESADRTAEDDRPARLALEELERAIQLAQTGRSELRGWGDDAPPSLKEQKSSLPRRTEL